MEYQSIKLQKVWHITALYCAHYFEFVKDFVIEGERCDFWKLVYVDKGEILLATDQEEIDAVSGDLFFLAPQEWHSFRGNGRSASNVLVIGFRCKDKIMNTLIGKRLRPITAQRALLRDILRESRASFSSRLDDPENHTLIRAVDAPIGSEQMIGCYMTELINSLIRRMLNPLRTDKEDIASTPLLNAMVAYMEQNVCKMLSMEQLAAEFHVSTSCIKRLFSQYKQMGAMEYFTKLKIERAKSLLREHSMNVFQIAETLGYDSHYFCNRFKKLTGMTPKEYQRSVNATPPTRHKPGKT